MCFQDQLGDALDVVVAAVWALVDGDPVASEEHPGFGTGK